MRHSITAQSYDTLQSCCYHFVAFESDFDYRDGDTASSHQRTDVVIRQIFTRLC